MNKYQITFLCPTGIYLSIRVKAKNLYSASFKAFYQARKFLGIPKGQPSGLRRSSVYLFIGKNIGTMIGSAK